MLDLQLPYILLCSFWIWGLFWIKSALIDYCQFCYFWQLKEYRIDRFKDFLSTLTGKKFLFSYSVCLRPIIYFIAFLSSADFGLFFYILALIFIIDLVYNITRFKQRQLKYPKITLKSAIIIIISICIEGILLLILFTVNYKFIFLLLACRLLIISGLIIIIEPLFRLIKNFYIKIAKNKLSRQDNLLVIGITGSYGKTTVKFFLEQILSKKFKVIKTPKNINTDIGIAKFILKTDFNKVDIFIVEMAAYKVGEIKLICKMVKPQIGILTAINEQHLQLFGSIKNTQIAKYELLRSLPESGLAIVNADNIYCREFLTDLKCNIKTFGQIQNYNPDCLIADMKTNFAGIEFTVIVKNKIENYQIKSAIVGNHNAMNIAPALLVADHLGLTKQEIIKQSAKLKLPEATMEIINYGKSLIINDSYNSNPEGFNSALKFLSDHKAGGKKIVITRGMLELGKSSDELHKKIGQQIDKIADELIIISPDFVSALKRGVVNPKLKIQTIFNTKTLLDYLKQNKNQENIILLENRIPEIVTKEIKQR